MSRRSGVALIASLALLWSTMMWTFAVERDDASLRSQVRGSTNCRIDEKLVPSCGILWGAAPAAFSDLDPVAATTMYESLSSSVMDVYHSYHRADDLFPTADERQIANGGPERRLLMTNWKPSLSHTWRQVANGAVDDRIDRLGAFIARTFPQPLFFVIWHEPENDVDAHPGSGMTAGAYRAMFRHVVDRLRAAGASELVFVMNYQGFPRYTVEDWYVDLWPGGRYVDWIAADTYNTGKSDGWNSGDFAKMVNRSKGDWPGFYEYWSEEQPEKPLMLAEWGVFKNGGGGRQASFFAQVQRQLSEFPKLKAMLYFNSDLTPRGDGTRIDATVDSQRAFQELTDSVERVGID